MRKRTDALQRAHKTLGNFLLGAIFLLSFNTKTTAQCIEQINVSLGTDCTAEITPAMIASGVDPVACLPTAFVVLTDPWGNVLPSTIVDQEMVGLNIKVELNAPDCGIICWGYAMIEDKLLPRVFCENDTVSCNGLSTASEPSVLDGIGTVALDFEDQANVCFTPITNEYPGFTFENAQILSLADCLNPDYPPSSGQNVLFSDTSPSLTITSTSGTWTSVSVNYSSLSVLFLEAYDAADNLLSSTSGPANLTQSDVLTVSAADIAYVIVHDSGDLFVIDDVTVTGTEANCRTADIILLNEITEALPCDPLYTSMVTRTFTAIDESGNQGDTCTQEILIERVDLTNIIFPSDTVFMDNDNTNCFKNQPMDDNGNPSPTITGVPTQNGLSLYPAQVLCMTYVGYSDIVLIDTPCKKKIIRTWEVREWWCDGETTIIRPQMIDIVDNQAPFLVCAADVNAPDFVAVTGQDCTADYEVEPPLILIDCNMPTWTVSYLLADADGNPPINGAYTNVGVVPFGDTYIIENLPAGRTWLRYTAQDACYNTNECFREIYIIDGSDPIAICQDNDVVSLNSDGKAWICAESIDAGSFDACGPVTIQIARMDDNCGIPENLEFGDCVEFCCEDLPVPDGSDGCHMVVMQVTDAGGRSNQCMVEVCVQNKLPALLSCPADVTVECTVDFDIDNLDTQFGAPTVIGNCSQMVSESATSSFDNCGAGSITRTFTAFGATDGPPTVCTQTITFVNSNPFDGNVGITWPLDYTADDLCSLDDLDPEDLPAGSQGPTIIGDNECSLVGQDYDDEIFQFANGQEACFKIIRHWTVIDWCQKINGVHPRWEWDQIIKINNTNGPIIGNLPDVDVESTDVDCSAAFVPLTASATDDCTDTPFLIWNYKIDANCDGTYDLFGTTNDASAEYPIGEHCIEWTVQDGCGNFTTATQDFSVENTKTPVPVCLNGLSAELTPSDTDGDGIPDNEVIVLWAVDFDASSYAPCGGDITFSFSSNVNDTNIEFDCDDIGIQTIQLWVTDENGNQSFCTTFVDIQDNNSDDICPPGLMGTVIGEIRTANDDMIESVQVSLEGSNSPMEMTDAQGQYDFGDMPVGGSYMVVPDKDDDYLNGVTTLDLIFIQRHVLGLDVLDSPYKILAADVNGSESVTSIDIVELRKLILGIYAELPNSSSWNFLNAAHSFVDVTDPWSAQLDNMYQIDNLQGIANIPFLGYKVGDVNNSATANLHSGIDAELRTQGLTLVVDKIAKQEDDMFKHPVYADAFTTLEGLQATISLNGVQGNLVGLESAGLDLDASNYAIHRDGSAVSMSWNTTEAIDFAKNEVLFYILMEGAASNDFELAEDGIKAEVYVDGKAGSLDLETRTGAEQVHSLTVNQNQPNPWSDHTEIYYTITQNSKVVLTIFDIQGRQVFTHTDNVMAGKHRIRLANTDLHGAGLYTYILQSDNETVRKKMLLIE